MATQGWYDIAVCTRNDLKGQNAMEVNLAHEIDRILGVHGHNRDDIVCVLWGTNGSYEADLSLDLKSFWAYAENMTYDHATEWASGPNYPMQLLSGKGWWIETTEYDSQTNIGYFEEPKIKDVTNSINENGFIKAPKQ